MPSARLQAHAYQKERNSSVSEECGEDLAGSGLTGKLRLQPQLVGNGFECLDDEGDMLI